MRNTISTVQKSLIPPQLEYASAEYICVKLRAARWLRSNSNSSVYADTALLSHLLLSGCVSLKLVDNVKFTVRPVNTCMTQKLGLHVRSPAAIFDFHGYHILSKTRDRILAHQYTTLDVKVWPHRIYGSATIRLNSAIFKIRYCPCVCICLETSFLN